MSGWVYDAFVLFGREWIIRVGPAASRADQKRYDKQWAWLRRWTG